MEYTLIKYIEKTKLYIYIYIYIYIYLANRHVNCK